MASLVNYSSLALQTGVSGHSATGFSPAERRRAPIKWEYCTITSAYASTEFSKTSGKAVVRYFQTSGNKEEIIELSPDIGRRPGDLGQEALAKAIARLGEDGWEIIAKEPHQENTTVNAFFFKRPKS